jgi:hypothetical protein
MGKKKSFYGDDLGLSIRKKMRELDLADREPEKQDHTLGSQLPADQEDEDWEERLYEP